MASPKIENPKIFIINTNLQFKKKLLPALSPNSYRSRLFYLVQIWIRSLYAVLQGEKILIRGLAEVLSPQITKYWVRKSQTSKLHFAEGPQICGFVISGTYFRTAHLCLFMKIVPTYTYIVNIRSNKHIISSLRIGKGKKYRT